jgi:hypothetical protein
MLLVNKKRLKLLWKQIVYTYSFYTMEEYLRQSWIMYCITIFLIILVLVLMFCLYILYKYSLIDYYELLTFLCINWCVLVVYCVHKLLLYIFLVKTHSVLCLLLSIDKFCIHFGGFLGYWINEYEKVRLSVRLVLNTRAGIVVTSVISTAGLSLSHSMQQHGALSFGQGGGRITKMLCILNLVKKNVLYVNPRIFLPLLSLSEFAYIGPTNLIWYRAHKYLNRPWVSTACNDARFQASVTV